MYAGTVVETAPAKSLFRAPKHPYTRALLACEVEGDASDDGTGSWAQLRSIPGTVPNPVLGKRKCHASYGSQKDTGVTGNQVS